MPPSTQYQSTSELLRQVLRTLLPTVRADLGGVFVFDEKLEHVVIGTIEGRQPPGSLAPVQVAAVPPLSVPAERWLFEHRRPLHLHRPRDWSRFPPVNPGLRALAEQGQLVGLAVPLQWEGELVGVTYVWRHHSPRPFTRREIREVERWCRLASAVALTSRLWAREALWRADLEALIELDRALDTVTSLARFARLARDALAVLLPSAALALTLRLDAETITVFSDDVPPPLRERIQAASSHLDPRTVADQDIVVLPRQRASSLLGTWVDALPSTVTDILSLPIAANGDQLGYLVAWGNAELASTIQQKRAVLSLLQRQLAAAAARLRHLVQLHRTIEQLRALLTVAQRVASADSVTALLAQVEVVLRARIRYDATIYLEPDPEHPAMLRVAWGSGTYPEAQVGSHVPVDRSLAGFVFRTGTSLAVADTWEDPRTYHRPGRRFPLRSLVIHPVRVRDEVVGVLGFGRLAVEPFSEYERELTGLIAHELGTALLVVRQRQALRAQSEDRAFLTELSWILLNDNDPRSFGQPLVDRVARWSGSDVGLACTCPFTDDQPLVTASRDGQLSVEQLSALAAPEFLQWLARQTPRSPLFLQTAEVAPPRFRGTVAELIGRYGTLALLSLAPEDRPTGFLLLGWGRPAWSQQPPLSTLQQLQAMLVDALQGWISGLERSFETRLTFELVGSRDTDTLAASFLEAIRGYVPYDLAAVFRCDERSGHLVPIATTPHFRSLPADWAIPFEALWPEHPGEGGEPIVLDEAEHAQLGYPLRHAAAGRPVSLFVAPIVADQERHGVVLVGRYGRRTFDAIDRRRLAGATNALALALHFVRARERERALYRASVEALAAAVDAKDPATHDHSRRVAEIAKILAQRLNLPDREVERIELAALLHDVGKLAVPDEILRKPEKLSPGEWSLVQAHPLIGAEILSTHPQLREIVPLVRAHHERWDGRGYPDGLSGEAIPLGAAIIGLADAFDTMISDRPYRTALRLSDAVEEIRRCRGTQFHPAVVDAFFAALRDPNGLPRFLAQRTVAGRAPLTVHTFRRIGEHVVEESQVETLAEVIDLAITGAISNDNIVIFLVDETGTALRIAYSRHDRDIASRVRLPRGYGLAWRSIETKAPQSVIVADAPPGSMVKWGRRELFAVLVAPLLDGDRPLGALAVSREEPRAFTPEEAAILASLGRVLGPLLASLRAPDCGPSTEQAVESNEPECRQQGDQDRLVHQIE